MKIAVICNTKRDFDFWKTHKWKNQKEMDNDGQYRCCNTLEKIRGYRCDKIIELWGARYNPEYDEIYNILMSQTKNKNVKFEDF
jgi:hypothetical protein